MICSVHTLGIYGIQGSKVTVECYISNGLPNFDIVGTPVPGVRLYNEGIFLKTENRLSVFLISACFKQLI